MVINKNKNYTVSCSIISMLVISINKNINILNQLLTVTKESNWIASKCQISSI